MIDHSKPILVLMGPTASGKSALAISLAKEVGGVILNADAMQCYADLRIITARPSQEAIQQAPHRLYGMWEARTIGNAALWQQAALTAIGQVQAEGKVPILVGGTGMYLKGLTEGLSPIPPISPEVKHKIAKLSLRHEDGMTVYDALQQHDPRMAAQLEPNDTQRVARALEVVLETGRSLLDWQAEQAPPPISPQQCRFATVDIPREVVYARINERFEQMIAAGALEEVAALKAQFSPEELAEQRFPILKAHGVPELMAYLDGEMSLERAIELCQRNTRHYAKRQMTWIRGQVRGVVAVPYDTEQLPKLLHCH